ncbi:hypothetical protein C8F04DRAFT_1234180 [Mycena alexandri]|uniref:Uncharacterized protein n=1 Tax=Mycena alexandri TaxID=1745969 RepID=A0AAD6X4H2_9AGAR|nr:hypothetical protein C8F04DRAFT_1234180 [Mycena alexandri]
MRRQTSNLFSLRQAEPFFALRDGGTESGASETSGSREHTKAKRQVTVVIRDASTKSRSGEMAPVPPTGERPERGWTHTMAADRHALDALLSSIDEDRRRLGMTGGADMNGTLGLREERGIHSRRLDELGNLPRPTSWMIQHGNGPNDYPATGTTGRTRLSRPQEEMAPNGNVDSEGVEGNLPSKEGQQQQTKNIHRTDLENEAIVLSASSCQDAELAILSWQSKKWWSIKSASAKKENWDPVIGPEISQESKLRALKTTLSVKVER